MLLDCIVIIGLRAILPGTLTASLKSPTTPSHTAVLTANEHRRSLVRCVLLTVQVAVLVVVALGHSPQLSDIM